MCYTVRKWTKVCPEKHCAASQICWRQCRRTREFWIDGRSRDHYTLCDQRDHARMLPLVGKPNISKSECEVCKKIDEDDTLQNLHQELAEKSTQLEHLRSQVNDLRRKTLGREHALREQGLSTKVDMMLSDWAHACEVTVPEEIDKHKLLAEQIQERIHNRKEDLVRTSELAQYGESMSPWYRSTDWKWRCHSLTTKAERDAMPDAYPATLSLPDPRLLASHGVVNGVCNWDETPLHAIPE